MSTQTDAASAATVPTRSRWSLGSVALVAAAALLAVSAAFQPSPGSGSDAAHLAAIDDAGVRAMVSTIAFVLAQLPLAVALVAVGRLIGRRSIRLGTVGVLLGVAGAFGESVAGSFSLVWIVMAHDETHRAAYAVLYGQLQTSPIMIFSLVGLAGSVLGLLLLSIGLFRSRVAPRWVGPALWAFLLLEYVGSAVTPVLGYVGVAAAVAAFLALAQQEDQLRPEPR